MNRELLIALGLGAAAWFLLRQQAETDFPKRGVIYIGGKNVFMRGTGKALAVAAGQASQAIDQRIIAERVGDPELVDSDFVVFVQGFTNPTTWQIEGYEAEVPGKEIEQIMAEAIQLAQYIQEGEDA